MLAPPDPTAIPVGSPVEAPSPPPVAVAADPPPDDGLLAEFLLFVREERRWVVAPMLVVLTGLSVVIVAAEGSAIAPFIYAVF